MFVYFKVGIYFIVSFACGGLDLNKCVKWWSNCLRISL